MFWITDQTRTIKYSNRTTIGHYVNAKWRYCSFTLYRWLKRVPSNQGYLFETRSSIFLARQSKEILGLYECFPIRLPLSITSVWLVEPCNDFLPRWSILGRRSRKEIVLQEELIASSVDHRSWLVSSMEFGTSSAGSSNRYAKIEAKGVAKVEGEKREPVNQEKFHHSEMFDLSRNTLSRTKEILKASAGRNSTKAK